MTGQRYTKTLSECMQNMSTSRGAIAFRVSLFSPALHSKKDAQQTHVVSRGKKNHFYVVL